MFIEWYSEAQAMLQSIIGLLPSDPIKPYLQGLTGDVALGLRWLNWFFPVSTCITILQGWCFAIALYYIYMSTLRWVKAI